MDIKKKPGDPQPFSCRCLSWAEIRDRLSEFPPPETTIGFEGEVDAVAWVFRGLRNACYELEPAIERKAKSKSLEWPALEKLASLEFKARARMHLSAPMIPEDPLTWLALLQHYGVPTRLPDFTYSPYVALYFAIRSGHECPKRTLVRVEAVDARAVNKRFTEVAWAAVRQDKKAQGEKSGFAVSYHPDDVARPDDRIKQVTEGLHALITASLAATSTRMAEQNRRGCVCVVSPPSFNPRLTSQQGVFMLNCADELSFEKSLNKLMGSSTGWRKSFDIPVGLIPRIEDHLFQMNIHEQSLFPDLEGLAGLIRQKIRLHWK